MTTYEVTKTDSGIIDLKKSVRDLLSKKGYSSERIDYTINKLSRFSTKKKKAVPRAGAVDHLPPCGTCGNLSFIASGTCHVCSICGESQGCS